MSGSLIGSAKVIIIVAFLLTLFHEVGYGIGSASPSDTSEFVHKKGFRPFIIPSLLIGSGTYAALNHSFINRYEIQEERNEYYSNFHVTADDYLQYAPIAAAYTLTLFKVKAKDDLLNMTIKLAKSELTMMAIVYPLKKLTHGARPDNAAPTTFPSGHTAQAFLAATFLDEQYRHVFGGGGYVVPSSVGVTKIINNRHWISDVLAGAGIGMLSVKLVSVTHQYKFKSNPIKLVCIPMVEKNTRGLYASVMF